ncbi:hypothetical protein Tco_1392400 [Tanacetum coccineum]
MISHEYRTPIKEKLRDLESRYIHEGRVVFDNFADLNYVRSLFHFVEFECLHEINEQICPRFILEFYSQYRVSYSDKGQMFVEFVIQNQFFSYSLEEFAQILDIPCEGACVFTDRWRLDELAYGIPSDGPYQTNLPSIEDIISSIRINRDGQVRRIRHEEEIDVLEYQVLTREIEPTLKPLEEIIQENVFCLGGNRDHVPACLCYMLYCVVHSERFNLAYFMTKRMEWVTKQKRLILPYGQSEKVLEGCGETFFFIPYSSWNSTNASSSNPSKKIKLTIIPPRQLFVNISSDEDITTTPSPTTTSSSPTPLNAPSKTTSTNQTSSSQENTSSSFHSKLQISPPSSHEPTSPHHLNPLLDNISDVPPRPLNPQPLQSHPSLDITLSLSPITPLDHIHDTPSPPSQPQPQPPIMGHPLFYNYHDYHGSTCICCSHNQNLFFTLRDEMNIMFAHLEYLLTTAITLHFPSPP